MLEIFRLTSFITVDWDLIVMFNNVLPFLLIVDRD